MPMPKHAGAEQASTRFKPGISGNPKGRPKGSVQLGTRVRAALNDEELVDWYVKVWRGEIEPTKAQEDAGQWLTERGWGKAAPLPEVDTGDPLGLELDTAAEHLTDRVVRLADAANAKPTARGNGSNGRNH